MKWILTHGIIFFLQDHTTFKVVAGSNYEIPGEMDEFRTIKKTVMGPKFVMDIMLCELEEPFVQSDRIRPANLPNNSSFVSNYEMFTFAGWTYKELEVVEEGGGRLGDQLKCGKVRKSKCHTLLPLSERFCFNMEGETQMCGGDYGIGVFYNDTLIGLTGGLQSRIRKGCSRTSGIAADVFQYRSWLHKITGINAISFY